VLPRGQQKNQMLGFETVFTNRSPGKESLENLPCELPTCVRSPTRHNNARVTCQAALLRERKTHVSLTVPAHRGLIFKPHVIKRQTAQQQQRQYHMRAEQQHSSQDKPLKCGSLKKAQKTWQTAEKERIKIQCSTSHFQRKHATRTNYLLDEKGWVFCKSKNGG